MTSKHPDAASATTVAAPIAMGKAEFDRHAELEDEHWWFRGRRKILLDRLGEWLPPGAGKRVMEIGCGTGGNLKALAKGYAASGVELDDYAARIARASSGCEVLTGDPRQVARDRLAIQDAVVLADVLEHIADDHEFLAAVVDMLKPGALLLITVPADPALWSPHDEALGHYRRYTAPTLQALWQDLPVKPLMQSAFMTLLYPVVRGIRRVRRRSSQAASAASAASDLTPVPAVVNQILYGIFGLEVWLMKRRRFIRGCSLLAVLRVGER
jgi:SAM-dependent methyltransferase